ncbi:MAG: hypothetical protein AAB353_04990, partial [Candidatus Hydrogenedentota bacterium]
MQEEFRYVVPYEGIETFLRLIVDFTEHNSLSTIEKKKKAHRTFFSEYFGSTGVSAKTVVCEPEYMDKDFLEDYASYYVRCFNKYNKFCARVHFFNRAFSQAEFEDVLSHQSVSLSEQELQDSYLGFVVLKRLPVHVLGRTCLKTYEETGERHYPIQRNYDVNLYGLNLRVRTLAFQEQDHA